MDSINDVPVTDEQITAWADEAERGYDVARLRKGGRPSMGDGPARVVPVRLDDALLTTVDERADRENVSRSEVIREAIRAYVS